MALLEMDGREGAVAVRDACITCINGGASERMPLVFRYVLLRARSSSGLRFFRQHGKCSSGNSAGTRKHARFT
jgi:hypothetical protein